jgi:hypothetical protein
MDRSRVACFVDSRCVSRCAFRCGSGWSLCPQPLPLAVDTALMIVTRRLPIPRVARTRLAVASCRPRPFVD